MPTPLSALLREARKTKGFSVRQVAAELGVSACSVYEWERGAARPPIQHLFRLASLLAIPLDQIAQVAA